MKNNYAKQFLTGIAMLVLLITNANAQSNNALDFDGSNDFVTSPQGSSLIAGSQNISLSLWVYPRNSVPGFPDFDGFAGLRNNLDADFYILQYSATTVEARFTGSSGVNYNIVGSGLQLNTWQHLALTYDGAMLRLYLNALPVDSIAASGTILNTNELFYTGDLIYGTTNYYLNGMLDEVSLWNRTLSPGDINCIYNNSADTSDAALKLYYRFNQGVAGGNNAGLNTLIDETGTSNGALSGFALNGTTSNWVGGINNMVIYTDTICNGQSYTFGSQTLTASGTYYNYFPLTTGCDSLVQLSLVVKPPVDTLVLGTTTTLAAHATGVLYQWINCGTGNIITGANGQAYSPAATGNYAVIITQNGCSDTSGCHHITVTGLEENNFANLVSVFPNPFTSEISIQLNTTEKNISVSLTDLNGKEIKKNTYQNQQTIRFNAAELAKGVYMLRIISDGNAATVPLFKY